VSARALALLAQRRATNAVKRALAARGLKVSQIPKREIAALARAYFDANHAALIARAVQDLEDLHGGGRAEPQGLSLCKSHDRNGSWK
jgi:hypothetical protein